MKHTALPWTLHHVIRYGKVCSYNVFQIRKNNNEIVSGIEETEEQKGNGELIVRACKSHHELVEACQLAILSIEENWSDMSNTLFDLKQALTKVTK